MKLKQLFEDVMNEPHIVYDTKDGKIKIKALVNRQEVGSLYMDFKDNAMKEFESLIDDPELDFEANDIKKIFPNNRFAEIDYLVVHDEHYGMGYGKLLMQSALNYARSKGETVAYLNAAPLGQNTPMGVQDLVEFYKKFGFQVILDDGHNVEMFANL
jgi:GNAT superfamily N-acetyltransferase